jgi:hypothetical protein
VYMRALCVECYPEELSVPRCSVVTADPPSWGWDECVRYRYYLSEYRASSASDICQPASFHVRLTKILP